MSEDQESASSGILRGSQSAPVDRDDASKRDTEPDKPSRENQESTESQSNSGHRASVRRRHQSAENYTTGEARSLT